MGDGTTCETICPINTEYGTCICQTLCSYPDICLPCDGEMCHCPDGFYLQGGDCVRQEDCDCYIDNNIVQEGQTYIAPGCSKRCTCIEGQLFCDENYRCDPNASCVQQNDKYHCICNQGFVSYRDTCVSICSTNEMYGTCSCEKSCGNPDLCTSCSGIQGQRCYCPNGFYLQGQDCVPREECNCFEEGAIIPEGQTYIAPGCAKRCTCINGQLSCDENYRCDANAACVHENSMYQCICNQGFVRHEETCISICSTNEIYGTCGCETSCGNPDLCTPCGSQGERCYCPNGLYLQGKDCITQEECNCFEDGIIIPEGQEYVAPGCTKRCNCINGQIQCDESYRCGPNAACVQQSNMFQCTCNDGFTLSGGTCESICSINEMYGTCSCERSCVNPEVCTPCDTQGQRCYCPNGFYIHGQDCVPQDGCGCYIDGTILQNGETYVDSECTQLCSCDTDQLTCVNYECSPNAVCREENNVRKCYCTEGYEGDGETCTRLMFTDCYDAYQAGERQDGVYSILPLGWTGSAFDVPCNMSIDGGGWTVLQRRIDGSEDFELNWNEFKNGFGVPGQEIWLGNDKMHIITNQRQYELRMDMVNLNGNAYFAKYSLFRIKDEDSNYQLELGIFDSATSTAGYDAMLFHRNKFFSTPDRDNDSHSSVHCAVLQRSSWWYNGCSQCNFNRPLIGSDTRYTSPYWFDYPTEDFLMYTDIKIRPV